MRTDSVYNVCMAMILIVSASPAHSMKTFKIISEALWNSPKIWSCVVCQTKVKVAKWAFHR